MVRPLQDYADYTVCRQKSPGRYILNLLLTVEIKSALGQKKNI